MITKVKTIESITEYRLNANNLKILFIKIPGTGIVTSDITYKVGSRDEARGETGIAHMLEHVMFKPTRHDIRRGSDSGAMKFEREIGCMLNATTGKDRTTYYFSYPKEHFNRALAIEAERMHDLVLTNAEFLPERANVLSEYDMYAGDEDFALSVQMMGLAMQSHPYGHEIIGYREDIESYTIEKLTTFYKKYYAPNNATLIIAGDITEREMKEGVIKNFSNLKPSTTLTERTLIHEPKQEGIRTALVIRPSTTNVLAVGVKHEGFPSKSWFETMIALELLGVDDDSILHKKLVDTGLASSIRTGVEPTYDKNLAILSITLTKKITHDKMYALVMKIISSLTVSEITPFLKKIIARTVTSELTTRSSSFGLVQELIEYESAHAWEHFYETENILKSITAKQVRAEIKRLFEEKNVTVGKFIGEKK